MVAKNYTENWIDTYQRYLGAIKFTAGDFDSIKSVVKDYIVRQNPEGYNDWQESSEVGMFVNALAYLGENINYRVDLNVNDLFPSSTNRKQSLLNFTRMLSYESKRNICANGLAKLVSVSTTQDIKDTSGTLLQNVTIKWDDQTNDNWLEQFLTVLNSAFTYTSQFGKPTKKIVINNISNQIYQFNNMINRSTVYPFNATINSTEQSFAVVNPDIDIKTKSIVELEPAPERSFHILYRNDGAGNKSKNTGFFVYWKQGTLNNEVFNFDERIENNTIEINKENINNNDVWFQELNPATGFVERSWTSIPVGENLSYSSVSSGNRAVYKVETQENDEIKVKFSDGYFGDIPYGLYRLWYRTSNGNSGLYIKPSDISNISIQIPYFNNINEAEDNVYYLTLTFSVPDVSFIRQAVPSESMEAIRDNASKIYSTQDRMVSSKDYNYFPRSIGQQLRILNAVERTYAGNSRFIKLNDPTGTYTDAKIIAEDGYIYAENDFIRSSIAFDDSMEPKDIVEKYIVGNLSLKELTNLYYQNYDGVQLPDEEGSYYNWTPIKVYGLNTMQGKLKKGALGDTEGALPTINDVKVGDLLCFAQLAEGKLDSSTMIWARVEEVEQTSENDTNIENIKISEVLDTSKKWALYKNAETPNIFTKYYTFKTSLDDDTKDDTKNRIINKMNVKADEATTFTITYVASTGRWEIADDNKDLVKNDSIEMVSAKDYYDGQLLETEMVANWIFRVKHDTETHSWIIDTHRTKNIFGSAKEASFFFNTSQKANKVYNYFMTKDTIKIMKENNGLDRDYYWKPYAVVKYSDGYIDPQKFLCESYDGDKDAVIDYPTQILNMFGNSSELKKIIFLNKTVDEKTNITEKIFLDYNDLYSNYSENATDKSQEAFNHSLWGHTLETGYYYSYHKINRVIRAHTLPKEINSGVKKENNEIIDKVTVHLPRVDGVICSNGVVENFKKDNKTIFTFQVGKTLDYDFVDYISGYNNGIPTFYDDVDEENNPIHGYLYYYNGATKKLDPIDENYEVVNGKSDLTFLWNHYATKDYIIDPCSTNIIDMFVQTSDYYNRVQEWVQSGKKGIFPKAPSSYELKGLFSTLEESKMISDTMVWHPVTYKLVFGSTAESDTHCIFKVIKRDNLISDNEVKKQVITLVDDFFKTMGVGETFYFTQLSTYIENRIPELIKTALIVPTDTTNKFGNLFQINCGENEILLSSATLDDVQIISSITEQNIRA